MSFDLLHHLMNVAVEYRHRTKSPQVRQRALAVVGAPAPLGIHGPERNVCEHDDGRAAREPLDVILEPFELFVAERAKAAGFEIHNVDQSDEVHSVLIETLPTR